MLLRSKYNAKEVVSFIKQQVILWTLCMWWLSHQLEPVRLGGHFLEHLVIVVHFYCFTKSWQVFFLITNHKIFCKYWQIAFSLFGKNALLLFLTDLYTCGLQEDVRDWTIDIITDAMSRAEDSVKHKWGLNCTNIISRLLLIISFLFCSINFWILKCMSWHKDLNGDRKIT